MATDTEILNHIQHIYLKIDQCYRAKEDIAAQIVKERADIIGLDSFINDDLLRIEAGKKPRYDQSAMQANIQRLNNNIILFQETIIKEDKNIAKFREVVKVLQDDMARPKEIIIDMTGK